jgi:hypothetical protein
MKSRAQLALSILAAVFLAVGLALIAGTLTHLGSVDQLRRLLSYDYMSFVDSQAREHAGESRCSTPLLVCGCFAGLRVHQSPGRRKAILTTGARTAENIRLRVRAKAPSLAPSKTSPRSPHARLSPHSVAKPVDN